jgi:large subunit ribosomal protein L25
MIADVQHDIVSRRIICADFHVVSLQEKVHAQVPVVHVGELAPEMKSGIVDHIAREVSVEAFPTDIPEHLEVDISGLAIGDNIRIKDLAPPEGVRILHSPDDVILVIAPPAKPVEVPAAKPEAPAIAETAEPGLVRPQEEE